MFDSLKFWKKQPSGEKITEDQNIAANDSIQSINTAIAQKIASSYTQRRYFNGEKLDGGMNYDTAFEIDHHSMKLKSMRAFAESMQARAIIKRLCDTVINTGLSLESTPEASLIGLSQEDRKAVSNKIEAKFNLWANSKGCDVSNENNLGQIERVEFKNQLIKGDFFAALIFSDDPSLINPLQVKIINPDLVSTPFDAKLKQEAENRGNIIVNGIELDENDQEVAFFVKSRKPGTFNNEWVRMPKYGPVSGRLVVTHGKTQDFGTESRGIPALSHVAHELEKITDYSLLELMAAVANATVASVVEPGDNAPATNPMPGGTFVPQSLINNVATDENLDSGYTNIGKNVMKNTGGLLVSSLNAGEKFVSHDTKRPNVNFGEFVDSITKYLAASLSIPIEVLHMQFGQNFSASRASLKLYWQSLAVWRDEFISDFLTPVYNSWLLGEVGTGNLILKGFEDPTLRAAWQSAKWIGIPSPSIDPFKEERAAQIRVKEGFTTREQESQRRHRTSFDSNVDRLAQENKRLADANEPLQETKTEGVAA